MNPTPPQGNVVSVANASTSAPAVPPLVDNRRWSECDASAQLGASLPGDASGARLVDRERRLAALEQERAAALRAVRAGRLREVEYAALSERYEALRAAKDNEQRSADERAREKLQQAHARLEQRERALARREASLKRLREELLGLRNDLAGTADSEGLTRQLGGASSRLHKGVTRILGKLTKAHRRLLGKVTTLARQQASTQTRCESQDDRVRRLEARLESLEIHSQQRARPPRSAEGAPRTAASALGGCPETVRSQAATRSHGASRRRGANPQYGGEAPRRSAGAALLRAPRASEEASATARSPRRQSTGLLGGLVKQNLTIRSDR